jgi:hypothetical protein
MSAPQITPMEGTTPLATDTNAVINTGNQGLGWGYNEANQGLHAGADLINQGGQAAGGLLDRAEQNWAPRISSNIEGANTSAGDWMNQHVPGAQEASNWLQGRHQGYSGEDNQTIPANLGAQTLGGAAIGAGLGGAAGLGYGLLSRDKQAAKLAMLVALDGDLEGSALEVFGVMKTAAFGTTLGTLGGIGAGAMLGNYLAPMAHWAMMPGEHGAVQQVAGHEFGVPVETMGSLDASAAAKAHAQALMEQAGNRFQDPAWSSGLGAGAAGARAAEWDTLSNLGRVGGAGIGGIAGNQLGRTIDEAMGMERKERPLIISPMAR